MVKISGQYAILSRGKICAKHMASGTWADKESGVVTLDQDGKWMISMSDGFSRKETVYVQVEDGKLSSPIPRRFHEVS